MPADHFEPALPRSQRPFSVFVPLLLLALTYLAWTVFQTTQMISERNALTTLRANQEKPITEAKKFRDRLDTISRDTQLLANRGNKGASRIVEELRKRGITITTDVPPPPSTAPSPAPPAK
jgi:hypothetical protein